MQSLRPSPSLRPLAAATPARPARRSYGSDITGVFAIGALAFACTGKIKESGPDLYDAPGAGATGGASGSSTGGSSGSAGNAGNGGATAGSSGTGTTGGKGSGGSGGSGGKGGSSGSSGDAGTSGSGGTTPQATSPEAFGECPDAPEAGVTPLSKLSTVQYRNTVRDLLAESGLEDVATGIASKLSAVPDDTMQASFRGLDKRISANHVNAYFSVATAVGDAATDSDAHLTALAGDCATDDTLSDACLDAFLNDFGRRALRRPLTDAELDQYRDVAQGDSPQATDPAEALRNVVVTLLMSPRFVNHLELEGTPVGSKDDYLALNPYEIASRLSYTFWQTLPDAQLLDAAESGDLATDAGFESELTRVFEDARTQESVWHFWNEWLRFDGFTGFSAERPAFKSLAKDQHVGEDGHDHWGDMVQEVRDLTDLYTWKEPGTFLDLMTSTVSVTRSADLARLYGVKAWSGSGDYPELPAGTRQGPFLRAALLVSSLETTNPFHRGSLIRRSILCEELEPPDPTTLPAGSLDPPPIDEARTTRERFAAKVEGNTLCRGCHSAFSNIGYTLEAFDSLGRFRTEEQVFDEQSGELLATLPVDAAAEIQLAEEPSAVADGPIALNQRLLESGKVEACLSANYFRYALRRDPTANSADACTFQNMRTQITAPGVGLAEVFRIVANGPEFRNRKVGAK